MMNWKAGCLLGIFTGLMTAAEASPPKPKVFGPSQAQEVYRVLLDRDAFLLESITDVIKEKQVQDGHVAVTAGSVQECTYHYVTSTANKPKDEYKTVKGPFEILGGAGIIANGEPHLHITLSSPERERSAAILRKAAASSI